MSWSRAILVSLFLISILGRAEEVPWRYQPAHPESWGKAQALLEKKKFYEVAESALAQTQDAEARLLEADAFEGLGLTFGAYRLWTKVARENPGTSQATQALLRLSQFHSQRSFPDDEVMQLVNEGRQGEVPAEVRPMVAYYTALDNMKKDLHEWVPQQVKLITPESYWGRRWKYLSALDAVKNNRLDEATQGLKQLSGDAAIEGPLKQQVDWQIARLNLDRGDYDAAEKIYSGFQMEGRDFGRAMLERAWIRYYRKDYSTALGILYSMRAPFFNASRSPEQYMLSMLIYKELCDYTAVQDVAKEFERVYGPVFENLKIKKLEDIPQLMSIVLVRADALPGADMVYGIRQQLLMLGEKPLNALPASALAGIKSLYQNGEPDFRRRFEIGLKDKLKDAANKLLVMRDQIRLLDYVASLDRLGQERGPASREYSAGKDNPLEYEKFYWPFTGEYWWGEIPAFKVLLKDRCGGHK